MDEFDSGGISALGAGFKGFAQGLMEGEDRKLKRMEMEAKITAQEQDRERQRMLDERTYKDREFDNRRSLVTSGFKIPTLAEGQSISDIDISSLPVNTEFLKAKAEADPMAAALKALALEKAKTERDDAAKSKTPKGKIEKLSGDVRKRFDDTTGSLDALIAVEDAYLSKPRKSTTDNADMVDIPLRGDTNYTLARNQFKEYLGRLQSGGAIGKQEATDFINLLPGATDTPAVAKKKLQDLKFRLESRLRAFGVTAEEASAEGFIKPETVKGLMRKGLVNPKSAAPPAKPQTIKQNGVTYTLNPQTGEYE